MSEQDQNSPENGRDTEEKRHPEQNRADGGFAQGKEEHRAEENPNLSGSANADGYASEGTKDPVDSDDPSAGAETNADFAGDRERKAVGYDQPDEEKGGGVPSHDTGAPASETDHEESRSDSQPGVGHQVSSEGQAESGDRKEELSDIERPTSEGGSRGERESAEVGQNAPPALVADQPGKTSLDGVEELAADDEEEGTAASLRREEVVDDLAHILESILFASDEPLPVGTIKSVLDAARTFGRVNPDMIVGRINALNAKYDEDGSGFYIVEIANGYQYATRKEMAQWVSNLFKERSKRRLSNSALETVAIIAYKQPITKPEIESIRGVSVDYVLHNLLEKELVTVVGRAESVGRPLLYGTTQRFLKIFALKSLDDLPRLREIDEIIKEIKSKGAEESIQLEITALGDSSLPEPSGEPDAESGIPSENGTE